MPHLKFPAESRSEKTITWDDGVVETWTNIYTGIIHRLDGPARIKWDKGGIRREESYWIDGQKVEVDPMHLWKEIRPEEADIYDALGYRRITNYVKIPRE